MPTRPPLPLPPSERDRLHARHLADQAVAVRRQSRAVAGQGVHGGALVVAYLLVLVFLLSGGYGVAATVGLVPAVAGSALATRG